MLFFNGNGQAHSKIYETARDPEESKQFQKRTKAKRLTLSISTLTTK